MREKLQTLSLAVLRDFAKDKKIKNITTMRKAQLINAILAVVEEEQLDEKDVTEKFDKLEQKEQEIAEKKRKAGRPRKLPGQAVYAPAKGYKPSENAQTVNEQPFYASADHAQQEQAKRIHEAAEQQENTEGEQPQTGRTSYVSYAGRTGHGEPRTYTRQSNRVYQSQYNQSGQYHQQNQTNQYVAQNQTNQHVAQNQQAQQEQNGQDEQAEQKPLEMADGILEVMTEGYGFIRCENFLPGENDVYVSPTQIRRFNLKTGDIIRGPKKPKEKNEKFSALMSPVSVNGIDPIIAVRRPAFESLTPVFPNERIHLEKNSNTVAMRMVDLISPIGKGQRGMIVSQPKSGKTTLLKQIANAITTNNPEMHLMILLIDERPEEVTDIKESIVGENVEVIYSTFDELPERHKRVSEMTIERAKRLVEYGKDVIILLDSITRLARAYNLTVTASGRTLSGGLDPAALHMPKRFFGAARNMREGGSLTILATALVETGSKMDDVVFEEFKGTGNMELVLDRKLSEKRVFPAINVAKSSTRRDDLLLDPDEQQAMDIVHKALSGMKADEACERILDLFSKTKNNRDFVQTVIKNRYV